MRTSQLAGAPKLGGIDGGLGGGGVGAGVGEGLAEEGEGGLFGGGGADEDEGLAGQTEGALPFLDAVTGCDGGGAEGGGVAVGWEGGGGVGPEGSGMTEEEEEARTNAFRRSFKSPIGRLAFPGDWGEGAAGEVVAGGEEDAGVRAALHGGAEGIAEVASCAG